MNYILICSFANVVFKTFLSVLSKNQIKFITSLHHKKGRQENNSFIAEGIKIVDEMIESDYKIVAIYTTALQHNYPNEITESISTDELRKISALTTPNQVLAVVEKPSQELAASDFSIGINLVLDGIADPGNLGTIIRIADWFGIKNILCSNDSVDVSSPKVIQSSMGSITRVKVSYTNLRDFLTHIKSVGTPIYGATLSGDSIYTAKLNPNALIIMGSESHGISPEIEDFISRKITIPAFNDRIDSLNVAVATAIICSEFRKN